MITEYVVGFAFSENKEEMVAILKKRPSTIASMLCGPGGKFDKTKGDTNLVDTMVREFEEETWVQSSANEWLYIQDITGHGGKPVAIFCAFGDKFLTARTKTDEEIFILNVNEALQRNDLVPEFIDLVTKALDDNHHKYTRIEYLRMAA